MFLDACEYAAKRKIFNSYVWLIESFTSDEIFFSSLNRRAHEILRATLDSDCNWKLFTVYHDHFVALESYSKLISRCKLFVCAKIVIWKKGKNWFFIIFLDPRVFTCSKLKFGAIDIADTYNSLMSIFPLDSKQLTFNKWKTFQMNCVNRIEGPSLRWFSHTPLATLSLTPPEKYIRDFREF